MKTVDNSPWQVAFARRNIGPHRKLLLKIASRLRWHSRDWLGRRLLRGEGIEIGAQYVPVEVDPWKASVEYVDAVPNEYLSDRYRLGDKKLVPLAHVVEGVELTPYPDGSKDFLVANHVLEHIDDPVGAVVEWLRVLRPGGMLFLSVPNYRGNGFDFRRKPTTRDHFLLDRSDPDGRPLRNFEHYCEMAQTMWDLPADDPQIRQTAQVWTDAGDRHHYHVFDEAAVRAVLELASDESGCSLRLDGYILLDHGFEWLVILTRGARGTSGVAWPSPLVSRPVSIAALVRTALSEGARRAFGRGRD